MTSTLCDDSAAGDRRQQHVAADEPRGGRTPRLARDALLRDSHSTSGIAVAWQCSDLVGWRATAPTLRRSSRAALRVEHQHADVEHAPGRPPVTDHVTD